MLELSILAEREMHEQAIARAFLYRRPHTRIIPGGLPVTYFHAGLPLTQGTGDAR